MCAKFKADHLSRFCTAARQVFSTQKPFSSKIPLTMKMKHQILFKIRFLIKLPSVKISFETFDVKQIYTREKSKYLDSIRVFPFFYFIFLLKRNKQETLILN